MALSEAVNNRELAIAAWIALLLAWVMMRSSIRASLKNVACAFLNKHILTVVVLMAAYIALVVWGLREAGLWDIRQLKTTIIWALFAAFVSLFDLQAVTEEADYFKTAAKDNLKLTVVLEFIVSFYTLGFWAEFLVVTPVSIVLGGMMAYAGTDKKYAPAENLLTNAMALFGVALLGYTLYKAAINFDSFATRETLVEFSLPPILSLLFLPFLYALAVFASYEKAFIRIGFIVNEPPLRSYAKRWSVICFRLNTTLLKRWATRLQVTEPSTKTEIDDTFRQIFEMHESEKNPRDIPAKMGWSPYRAKDFLANDGLRTGYYQPVFEEEWTASSPYKDLGDGILPNHVAYYVDGNRNAATALKLVLNINEPALAVEAIEQFVALAKILHKAALNVDMPDYLVHAVSSGCSFSVPTENSQVSVKKEMRGYQTSGKYALKFSILRVSVMGKKIPNNG